MPRGTQGSLGPRREECQAGIVLTADIVLTRHSSILPRTLSSREFNVDESEWNGVLLASHVPEWIRGDVIDGPWWFRQAAPSPLARPP